jgi:hypothetical protein
MKSFVIFAVIAAIATAGAASADPVSVAMPKDPASKEQAALYIAKLESAVKRVCADETRPIMGVNYYAYVACLKATRAVVAANEPTGLYAGRDAAAGTVIAAR